MSTASLALTALLLLIPILVSYKEKLNISKDLIIASIRAVVQLLLIGLILDYVFKVEEPWLIIVLTLVIMVNAAWNTVNRASSLVKHVFWISLVSMLVGGVLSLSFVLITGAIDFNANEVIPVAGMLGSNGMIAINLAYQNLDRTFKKDRELIESKLALGATPYLSSKQVIRESVKVAIVPTIDSVKTYGLVSIPGMMTGLIIAGVPPLEAIKFQLMVVFIHTTATIMCALCATYLSYRQFFNERHQVKQVEEA
ncbi:ABC transporter permease [Staphylococcus massiliensis]|uniref:YbbM seven transmembrane helix protein n=1 Tax=Staphylococcus massiliensis S46 TaxID=1229783 RepID=K9AKJ6_9STAP|nr:iron export ABC transporter permease subunit FetB [Staphylococcus massiliensis]EKU47799.1 YbbM seven transmembrane helix protein [Staphylococcus massiliensis S46]MCG3399826.1 iron export ABC transporter permease subunit FetB [Staphylococcus massiliensis]MCG3401563.1 iron export ABC transporter permease subunit FetB [Staphylococcus massiliensis]MCG3413540.1 iron export ABC transporter permease subunit FetB [Staphylococcus massiliensis]PNZ98272.1 iron export ABC transporter permease subunit F